MKVPEILRAVYFQFGLFAWPFPLLYLHFSDGTHPVLVDGVPGPQPVQQPHRGGAQG